MGGPISMGTGATLVTSCFLRTPVSLSLSLSVFAERQLISFLVCAALSFSSPLSSASPPNSYARVPETDLAAVVHCVRPSRLSPGLTKHGADRRVSSLPSSLPLLLGDPLALNLAHFSCPRRRNFSLKNLSLSPSLPPVFSRERR